MMMSLLAVSKWEFRRVRLNFGKNTLMMSFTLLIMIAAVSFLVLQYGLHINDNIYRVAVTDPGIAEALKTDNKFEVHLADGQQAFMLFEEGAVDLLITGKNIRYRNSEKSISALDALDRAITRYDESRLLAYDDLNNTFPVWITVRNLKRQQEFPIIQKILEPGKTQEEAAVPAQTVVVIQEESTGGRETIPSIREAKETKDIFPVKEHAFSTPSHFNPPFPFKSVVLSFLFIFPMYFIAQLYSSSMMEERVRRKGELLLASPLRPYEIVLGKLLPYLLMILLSMAGVTLYLGGNALMLAILLPVSLMFLSTAFLGAIIARSFKELSFVLIFLSVILSGYIFFPAMFANVHSISIISPVTLVVMLLEGESISASEYFFSTLPFYLVSILIFVFGIFIYCEEDLFSQKPIKAKLLDSVHEFIKLTPFPLFFLSVALMPLVYSLQLMLIVLMFNLPVRSGIVVFIVLAAFTEEAVKSVGIYTVFSRKIAAASTLNAIKFGIFSGMGFFAGEKLLLLIVISSITGSVFGSAMGAGLLLFPLLLHVTSTTAASLGLRSWNYPACVILASVIHSAYNLYIIRGVLLG
ncbi:MAG TPA: ABC transporter permease [Candidatus Methanoperedens sp.]